MNARSKKTIQSWLMTVILLTVGTVCIYPFIFMVSSSFKISAEVLSKPLQIIPDQFTLRNFTDLFGDPYYNFGQWYINTIVMVGTTILLKIFIITYTAYGFAKIKFRGNGVLFLILMSALMIPGDIMLIPRYSIFKSLHILDTMWSLVLPSCFDIYFVFMLRQAFVSIPDSISEAAEIDGCHHFTIYWKIILPLAKPSIVTMVLFTFVWSWNDYMGPYIYISTISKQMLSVGIKLFTEGQVADPALQMSSATLVLIPVLILFFFTQRYFVEGSTSSAVKG